MWVDIVVTNFIQLTQNYTHIYLGKEIPIHSKIIKIKTIRTDDYDTSYIHILNLCSSLQWTAFYVILK